MILNTLLLLTRNLVILVMRGSRKHINNNRYTARQWMKEYERLKSNGELDFIEMYIKEEGD